MSCSSGVVGSFFYVLLHSLHVGAGWLPHERVNMGILCLFLYTKENILFLVETDIADL